MYPVIVENGRRSTWRYSFKLHNLGLVRDHDHPGTFKGKVETKRELSRISRFCNRKQLKFYIDNSYGRRSSNYRSDFFYFNKPIFFGRYFCAYCGKPQSASKITVDHLYPIGKVRKDLRLQKRLSILGIDDINSEKNLVPACEKCNKKKGTKMGAWIINGMIGKH